MISVICTTYNMAGYITKCIRSVLGQTYRDTEIIIIDDGSEDETAGILERFRQQDSRIRVITQSNKGHSEARNVGVEASRGDFIYFIDADDYIHPQTLLTLKENMDVTGADISIGNVTRGILQCGGLINERKMLTLGEALKIVTECRYTVFENPMKLPLTATWNKIFKRRMFDNVHFPAGRTHDDNFTVHRFLADAEKVVYTPAITYRYTNKPNSISNTGLYSNMDMVMAYEDRIQFFDERRLTKYLPDTLAYFMHVCARTYECTKDREPIYRAMAKAVQYESMINEHRAGRTNYERIKNLFENHNSIR